MIYVVFVAATVAIFVVGPRLARVVETIADRLGIGQVLVGAVLLGVVTSLPGLVLTVTAAARGDAELAVSNALGGVAAQTFFLAVADLFYRTGTLSSGVPTRQVTYQAAFLLVLLGLVVVGLGSAEAAIGRVHPVTPMLAVAYVVGLSLSRRVDRHGGTELAAVDAAIGADVTTAPASAAETPAPDRDDAADHRRAGDPHTGDSHAGDSEADDSEAEGARGGLRGKMGELEEEPSPRMRKLQRLSTPALWARFAAFAGLLSVCGFGLAWAGSSIAEETPLSASSVGLLLTAVATSTPELVTAVAAARSGAIGLAAGDIIGGNVFDTLFIAAADVGAAGSIFAQAGDTAVLLAGFVLLLNALLLAGLVRQGVGTRNVDRESAAIALVWVVMVAVTFF